MILRISAALSLTLALTWATQAQVLHPRGIEFENFVAELWKDAQAKGISRTTFVRAFDGVTVDPRVIATSRP